MPTLEVSDEEAAVIERMRNKPKRGRPKGRKNLSIEERRANRRAEAADIEQRREERILKREARRIEAQQEKYDSLKQGEAHRDILTYPLRDSVSTGQERSNAYFGSTLPRGAWFTIGDGCFQKKGNRPRT